MRRNRRHSKRRKSQAKMDNNYEGWQTFLLNILLKMCCLGVQFGIVLHEEEKKIKNLIELLKIFMCMR